MQSTNKVLCNVNQELTELEKYTARGNIAALAAYGIATSTRTITVDQTSSNNGTFISTIGNSKPGIYLLNVNLHVDSGTMPSDRSIPFRLYIDCELEGGGVSGQNIFTGVMTKHDSDNTYYLAMSVLVQIKRTDTTGIRFIFTCEAWKIPQGTALKLDVGGVLIGNIEPTP